MPILKVSLLFLLSGFCLPVISQCDDFAMTITPDHPTCHNFTDGDIDITISGGTGPYWVLITDENGTIVPGGKKSEILGPGWYYILLTDANGCEIYDSVQIINPPEMIAEIIVTDPSSLGACDGAALVDTVLNFQGDFTQIAYFWSPGGPMGIGETLKTDLCDANYTLTINDAYGCSIVTDLAVGSVSISESELIPAVSIFPHPVNDVATLTVPAEALFHELKIYNSLGQLIQSIRIDSETVTFYRDQLPAGIYYYELNGSTGKIILH